MDASDLSRREDLLQGVRTEIDDTLRYAALCAHGRPRTEGDFPEDPEDCFSYFTLVAASLERAQWELGRLGEPLLFESRALLVGCAYAIREIDRSIPWGAPDIAYEQLRGAVAEFLLAYDKTLKDVKNRVTVLWMDTSVDALSAHFRPQESLPKTRAEVVRRLVAMGLEKSTAAGRVQRSMKDGSLILEDEKTVREFLATKAGPRRNYRAPQEREEDDLTYL